MQTRSRPSQAATETQTAASSCDKQVSDTNNFWHTNKLRRYIQITL